VSRISAFIPQSEIIVCVKVELNQKKIGFLIVFSDVSLRLHKKICGKYIAYMKKKYI
jgi:hypothetical protein